MNIAQTLDSKIEPSLTLDRGSAALEQIEVAIQCLFNKKWAACTTLALAVEGMLPPCPDNMDIYGKSKSYFAKLGYVEKDGIAWLNRHRDWLKHLKSGSVIHITELDCIFAIWRGLSRIYYCTGRVSKITEEFEDWLRMKNEIERSLLDNNAPLEQVGKQ